MFEVGDLIRAYGEDVTATGNTIIYKIDAIVTGDGGTLSDIEIEDTNLPYRRIEELCAVEGIEFVRIGNLFNPARQNLIMFTVANGKSTQLFLKGIDSFYKFDHPNPVQIVGDLEDFSNEFFPIMTGEGTYLGNAYINGFVNIVGGPARGEIDNAQAYANAAYNYAQSINNSLGALAYEDLVEYAKLGSTLIEGGYLKNYLIDTQAIIVQANQPGGALNELLTDKQDAIVNGKTVIVGGYLNTEFIETDSITVTHLDFVPVKDSDVIAKINASAEGIKIQGENITLSGDTTINGDFRLNGSLLFGQLNAKEVTVKWEESAGNSVELGNYAGTDLALVFTSSYATGNKLGAVYSPAWGGLYLYDQSEINILGGDNTYIRANSSITFVTDDYKVNADRVGLYGVNPTARQTLSNAVNNSTIDTTYGTEEANVITSLRLTVNELIGIIRNIGIIN